MNIMRYNRAYFIGIGGIGMSALARYFIQNKWEVAGYDKTQTPLTKQLIKEGISVHYEDAIHEIPSDFKNIERTLVVYTPAVPKDHKELNYFIDNQFDVFKRARAVAEIANSIKKDKTGILEKAHAVYDWVVENTSRDPSVKGCGLGIVEVTLSKLSGKCADISSVYVALARNVGVPAREVFGLRLGTKPEQDITADYHCWAEFYLPGTGWVAVDPADVRKKMLTDNLALADAKELREYFFGGVDAYRMVLERGGRGITLQPAQESKPINYLMYPYAEIDGKEIDYFDPENFRYSVQFKQL